MAVGDYFKHTENDKKSNYARSNLYSVIAQLKDDMKNNKSSP